MVGTGGALVSRRPFVLGASAAAAAALAGCGIRLENDAPNVPGLRTQGPPPDQAVLLATLASLQSLLRRADALDAAASPWVPPVRAAHRAQITRLVDVLAGLGVQVPSASGSATPSPAPSATPSALASTASPSSTRRRGRRVQSSSPAPARPVLDLARAELTYATRASERAAWSATPDNRAMLVSVCAARRAAALVLGDRSVPERGSAPAAVSAAPLARVIRPAVYGFELIAARTPAAERDLVRSTLAWLYGARSDLDPLVGEPTRPSYALPVRVTDGPSARRLARALLHDVTRAAASQVTPLGPQGRAPQSWVLRVWSRSSADLALWGDPLAPFPGLRT